VQADGDAALQVDEERTLAVELPALVRERGFVAREQLLGPVGAELLDGSEGRVLGEPPVQSGA